MTVSDTRAEISAEVMDLFDIATVDGVPMVAINQIGEYADMIIGCTLTSDLPEERVSDMAKIAILFRDVADVLLVRAFAEGVE